MSLAIGIDVGTTSTKAGVYRLDGTAVCTANVETRLHRSAAGAVEQDPRELLESAYAAVAACVAHPDVPSGQVAAVAVTGQMAGVLGIDARWEPVTPYDSWLDSRCAPQLEWLARNHGDVLVQRTGCPPMIDHAPKMLWWRDERPAEYERIAAFVMPAVYVAGVLGGLTAADAFVDPSYLHFSGVADGRTGAWSDELIEGLGLDAAKLPAIVAPDSAVGRLTEAAARRTGLPAGIAIAAGLGDTAAGVFGAGIVEPGQLLDTAGTAAVLVGCVDGFRPDPGQGLLSMRGVLPGQWLPLNYVAGGGLCIPWLLELTDGSGPDALRRLLDEAAAVAPGADGLLFLPHLDGRIAPHAPAMRGGWLGLRASHGRAHMARSILEAIAFEYATYVGVMRTLHPGVEFAGARVIGGGARSPLWNQIKADVLGVRYQRLVADETATRGAAMIASAAAGLQPDLAAIAADVQLGDPVEPDPGRHAAYAPLAERYARVVDAIAQHTELLNHTPERQLVA